MEIQQAVNGLAHFHHNIKSLKGGFFVCFFATKTNRIIKCASQLPLYTMKEKKSHVWGRRKETPTFTLIL